MTKHGVKVSDLKDQIGVPGPRPFLWCSRCGQESSANRGDYFMTRQDYIFRCCGVAMRLVTKAEVLTEVQL